MPKQVLNQTPAPDLDAVFSALAHPIRRAIIEQLARGECTVSELAAPHDVSKPAISQHLRVLEDAKLVEQTKDGRLRICTLQAAPLSAVFSWTLQYRVFWENVLDQVQASVEAPRKELYNDQSPDPATSPPHPRST